MTIKQITKWRILNPAALQQDKRRKELTEFEKLSLKMQWSIGGMISKKGKKVKVKVL